MMSQGHAFPALLRTITISWQSSLTAPWSFVHGTLFTPFFQEIIYLAVFWLCLVVLCCLLRFSDLEIKSTTVLRLYHLLMLIRSFSYHSWPVNYQTERFLQDRNASLFCFRWPLGGWVDKACKKTTKKTCTPHPQTCQNYSVWQTDSQGFRRLWLHIRHVCFFRMGWRANCPLTILFFPLRNRPMPVLFTRIHFYIMMSHI